MKIKELEAFIAVVDEGGIVKAAEKMFCVPSNISKLINELESRNEQTLFNRDHRELTLTPYGRFFYEQSKKFINDVERFKEITLQSQEIKLLIGGIDIALDYFLPKYIYRYQIANKNVNFQILRGYSRGLESMISNHEYDLIFSDGPIKSPRLDSKLVFQEQLLLVRNIEIGDNPTIYSYGKTCTYREYTEQWAREYLKDFRIIEIESYPLMLTLIHSGMGMAFIPNSIIQQNIQFKPFVDSNYSIKCDIYMIWHKLNKSSALTKFIEYFSLE